MRLAWGTFQFDGHVEALEETLETPSRRTAGRCGRRWPFTRAGANRRVRLRGSGRRRRPRIASAHARPDARPHPPPVAFTLAQPQGPPEEAGFLAAAARLADVIPGVEAFEVLREVSPKNGFVHGLSMEFADRAAYDLYNEHPEHVAFVQERWLAEVTAFQEIDSEAR